MLSRFSISFLLLPIFLFALAVSPNLNENQLLWSFIIIHFLVYPAASGFHGLPKTETKASYVYYSILLFAIALVLAFVKINLTFTSAILIYGLASIGHGNHLSQFKKHPLAGWLFVGLFQGFFTVLMCYVGINKYEWNNLWNGRVLIPALLVYLLMLGVYPITQILTIDNDKRFEDKIMGTLSKVRTTYRLVAVVLIIAITALAVYFYLIYSPTVAIFFLISMALPILYFILCMIQTMGNSVHTNNNRTRWFLLLLAICLNTFMVWFFLETSHILQL